MDFIVAKLRRTCKYIYILAFALRSISTRQPSTVETYIEISAKMYYDHCVGTNCFKPKHNFSPNPVPKLRFPTKTHFMTTLKSTTEAIKTTIIDALQPFTEKNDVPTPKTLTEILTTTTPLPATEEKVKEIITTSTPMITESTTMQKIMDTFNSTVTDIVESANNNTTVNENNFNTNDIVVTAVEEVNNTAIQEIINTDTVQLTTDAITALKNEDTATEVSDIVTSTTDTIVSTVQSATEKVLDFLTTLATPEKQYGHDTKPVGDTGNHSAIYVILGIIVAILLVMCVILVIIFIRYRKNQSHSLLPNTYYNKKENIPSSPDQEQECVPDVYVQYTC
ncbi:hypothetical protein FQA39_LY12752 [Lamprigera yunnana]|nr:hypothetical protein FQA39_LY12752 [Lamprigera yunnana]